jgi:hypothetical protein
MKKTVVNMLALLAVLLIGVQAQAQNIDEKKMVGTYKFEEAQDVDDGEMKMNIKVSATIELKADHSATREGVLEIRMPVEIEDYSNTFILTFNLKSKGETWALEGDNMVNDVKDLDMKFVSAKAEKSDMMATMMLGEVKRQGDEMAEGFKQFLVGKSTEKVVKVDDKGITTAGNGGAEMIYVRQ